jgi:hypothetical protein
MLPDIAHSGRSKQCVNQGMNENVSIGVTIQAPLLFDPNTTKDKRPFLDQSVRIVAYADSEVPAHGNFQ